MTSQDATPIKNVIAILQARMGSERCPGKSMELIGGVPVVEMVLRRLSKAKHLSKVVLATSDLDRDTVLAETAAKAGFAVFRGSETDLVGRFLAAADAHGAGTHIVRTTGDNVFMDWNSIDMQIEVAKASGADFTTWINESCPDRMNDFAGEVIRLDSLRQVAATTQVPFDREHVYPYFFNNPDKYRVLRIPVPMELRTTVKLDLDYPEDLALMKKMGEVMPDPVNVPAAEAVRIANQISAKG